METFKLSRDTRLKEEVVDIVGLYLNPLEQALALGVDRKSQIQELSRTQPLLQLRPGQIECHTHDYKKNGTTTLFAAFNNGAYIVFSLWSELYITNFQSLKTPKQYTVDVYRDTFLIGSFNLRTLR